MFEVSLLLAFSALLAAPGLAGYALAAWRARAGGDAWPAWFAWALPTAVCIAFWVACWRWAVSLQHESGLDDGSVPMSLACLVASVVGNVIAGVSLLGWNRRMMRRRAGVRGSASEPS